MGQTLNDPDFVTTRGPLVEFNSAFAIGSPVRYTMGPEINAHFPTNGELRTFHNVCRVRAEEAFNFVKSILPDVYEDEANPMGDQALIMSAYGAPTTLAYDRNPLIRLNPERHPRHPRAFAVDAVYMSGEGFPSKADDGDLTFRTRRVPFIQGAEDEESPLAVDGYVKIGVTWRDLPYETLIDINDEDAHIRNGDDAANADSEIIRYCVFKPSVKGQHLQIPGANVFFVDDDGKVVLAGVGLNTGSPPFLGANLPLTIPEPQPHFVPSATYSVTWKMIPRVPIAADLLRGMVNQTNTLAFPREFFSSLKPDVDTLLYLGYELSDPYFTVSGRKVFDLTYSFGYRASGDNPKRGWNSAWCARKMDFRRVVVGVLAGGQIINPAKGTAITQFPISTDDILGSQTARVTDYGANLYNFGELSNLFCFENNLAT